ncbi:MAG: hypothetical protein A2525_00630 [Sulfurimonas sp. RIFOXYD12_FULL_36_11]|uniref:DUF2513 domain-containing protein n=1 Tax=unclassified Sulfurimonas TaxID=2623549 RepID=UPI0008B87C35|nr:MULTISPECIES: DUF2513 domain-containing protein [unclassified Sulfurimonas]OHE18508.1 MAG: hypothetical protein A2525_00630 [Sulfurimonas sp. RIFOXYD12_FULL_36_11]MBS4068634.1 DUF2513 domain-containing protein [Sulfurimonas sp.]MDD3855589.1 DUF2513 domain-containing protein [Sulfurimonas sp.]MDX9757225.1 DUF2513 domain-containing protein [Sulfurimonas sp.]OHE05775.1 MAG: hypothetical protein A2345_08345 [Sulfurimonas sp. RIFOXYB12_FULL_35_9]
MKRDLDLIREIMLVLEDEMEYGKNFTSDKLFEIMQNKTLSLAKLTYHIGLLVEGNFIRAKELKTYSDGSIFTINTITSEGQDFLDTIRQKDTWEIVKENAVKIGGFTLPLIVELGKDYLKKQIGLIGL